MRRRCDVKHVIGGAEASPQETQDSCYIQLTLSRPLGEGLGLGFHPQGWAFLGSEHRYGQSRLRWLRSVLELKAEFAAATCPGAVGAPSLILIFALAAPAMPSGAEVTSLRVPGTFLEVVICTRRQASRTLDMCGT
ncbi:hypothetical protein EJ02DRAFT_185716 [Clathrospora elynae]|uniref:Uncharacterized protein n=1 Tax=Clathrospora elynae TaxID=706981 RepID=A0A6A5SQZ3_9PLEO|nr:hypothetical protein EJ02DRAFT_185716 [Clathrospora elynae]